jgi:uncharacterized protein (DUF885 family)
MRTLLIRIAASAALAGAPAAASADSLGEILEDHWAWTLAQDPVFATSVGVRTHDDRLPDRSLAAYAAQIDAKRGFLRRLEALDPALLDTEGALNRALLSRALALDIEESQYGAKFLAITNRSGPHIYLTGLPDDLPFFSKSDFESYIARLNAAPSYVDGVIERLAAGAAAGWTQPCEAMDGYEKTIRFHIVDEADKSVLMRPFADRPATISAGDWKSLRADAAQAIEERVVPAFAKFAEFYEATYRPACRRDLGADQLPQGGPDYYAYLARRYTTTDLSIDDIHKLGRSEVNRIRKEMEATVRAAKFDGDLAAFQNFLRTDPRFYARSAPELMEKNALVAKRIDGELPKLFSRLPRMPYTVKEIPPDIAEGTTTAYYERPSGDGARAGVYRINTSKLDTRPLYEIEALTLHEAVPGHHLQIALAQELDLPEFRKYSNVTAFIEGWALYAESLGLDVGFYDDPYANFGRLSYEMWRACRLVVDTGIHAKGWTRRQAIDFMKENTALSEHNIEAEVDRYIANPGQALTYKIGQLKIRSLRTKAERSLGAKFDLRRFHDAVLEAGALPMSLLEAKIDRWIAAEMAK